LQRCVESFTEAREAVIPWEREVQRLWRGWQMRHK
jgi:hypothetical protein